MKSITVLSVLSVLVIAVLSSVNGQTGDYLWDAFNSSSAMRTEYYYEVDYWSTWLTIEMDDVGEVFTDLVVEAVERSTNAAQGDAIARCSLDVADRSKENYNYMADTIRRTKEAANALHLSVLQQFIELNIKEYDLELFYYYHSYIISNAYYALHNDYSMAMMMAWLEVFEDFFYLHEQLEDCIAEALSRDRR